jgi:hypothetical protein
MEKIRIEQHSFGGLLWPVYLGAAFSPVLRTIAKLGQ